MKLAVCDRFEEPEWFDPRYSLWKFRYLQEKSMGKTSSTTIRNLLQKYKKFMPMNSNDCDHDYGEVLSLNNKSTFSKQILRNMGSTKGIRNGWACLLTRRVWSSISFGAEVYRRHRVVVRMENTAENWSSKQNEVLGSRVVYFRDIYLSQMQTPTCIIVICRNA